MNLPSTIKYPEAFNKSVAAGFDGVFDWSWTDGCFGNESISPMDFDGVFERKGNFLIFETKAVGQKVPIGQMYTLLNAYKIGFFTIIFIEGKKLPELAKVWCQPGFKGGVRMESHKPTNALRMNKFVKEWREYSDANPVKGWTWIKEL